MWARIKASARVRFGGGSKDAGESGGEAKSEDEIQGKDAGASKQE